MPQMAPIWWSTLFLTFILSFLMIWVIMYFQSNIEMKKTMINSMIKKELNWKW